MDKHIDNQETQTYGPRLRENLAAAFTKSTPAVKKFVAFLIALQKAVDETMAIAIGKAAGAGSDLTEAAREKLPAVRKARTLLSGLMSHLVSLVRLEEWSGSTKRFLPKGLNGIGRGVEKLLGALEHARKELSKAGSLPGAKALAKKFAAAKTKLDTESKKSSGALKVARSHLSDQSKEKKAWLRTYRANVLIATGLLMLEGREGRVASLVPHRAVAGSRRRSAKKGKSAGEEATS